MIGWIRRVAPWKWHWYREFSTSLLWIISPLTYLPFVLWFGLPWWILLLPLPIVSVDWQTHTFHFNGFSARLCWLMWSAEFGAYDDN